MTKHRTDRTDRTGGEIAAGKAQINYRDLVINLYTAYHSANTAPAEILLQQKIAQRWCGRCGVSSFSVAGHPSVVSKLRSVEFMWRFVV